MCLAFADSLERYFTSARKYKFHILFEPDAEHKQGVYFCHLRKRGPQYQITHVLALCSFQLVESDTNPEDLSIIKFTAHPSRKFQFGTVWQLARWFLIKVCKRVLVQTAPHKFRAGVTASTTLAENRVLMDVVEVFPTPFKAQKPAVVELSEAERAL